MNIKILRYRRSGDSIDGILSVDNVRFCDTVENASRHLAEGDYSISLKKCGASSFTLPLIDSQSGIHRDCSRCMEIAMTNAEIADRCHRTLESVFERGRSEGKSEQKCVEESLLMESSMPPHVEKLPMPFCPRLIIANGTHGCTDSSIAVGTSPDVPGMVIGSRQKMDALLQKIRRQISRGSRVTLTVMERFTVILLLAVTLSLTGCRTSRHTYDAAVPPVKVLHDTVVMGHVSYDSIYISNDRFQDRTGDTVYVRDRNIEYRYRLLHDTLRVIRRDSIPYEVRVTEVREVPRRRGVIDYLSYCCLGLVAGVILYRFGIRRIIG